jgi:hypothetical protein
MVSVVDMNRKLYNVIPRLGRVLLEGRPATIYLYAFAHKSFERSMAVIAPRFSISSHCVKLSLHARVYYCYYDQFQSVILIHIELRSKPR